MVLLSLYVTTSIPIFQDSSNSLLMAYPMCILLSVEKKMVSPCFVPFR